MRDKWKSLYRDIRIAYKTEGLMNASDSTKFMGYEVTIRNGSLCITQEWDLDLDDRHQYAALFFYGLENKDDIQMRREFVEEARELRIDFAMHMLS